MNPNFTTLKVKLKNEEKILNFVPPDLYNLKLDIQKLFNLTEQQMKNITFFAKIVSFKGTSVEVKLEKLNDYNDFVLAQQKFALFIEIKCELNESEEDKDKIINDLKSRISYLEEENKNLIEKNNTLNNNKENEKNSFKKILEEKEQIITKLEQSKNSYRNQLKNLLDLAYLNNLKINFPINSSLFQSGEPFGLNGDGIINNNLKNYNYEFIDNNSFLEVKKEDINKKKIFDYYFRIKNIGADWPIDTLLKCVPDESNIYFFHFKIKDGIWSYKDENLGVIYVFPVKILFKNYNKFNKINKLSCFLISDRYGRIGNKIGKMEIKISDY